MLKKRNYILSLCLSGHGFSGSIFINGKLKVATTLERITRVKNDILLPLNYQDLEDFGWKADPKIYNNTIDLPFDFTVDPNQVEFEKNKKFKALLKYLLEEADLKIFQLDCVVYSYRYISQAKKFFSKFAPKAEFLVPEHHLSHACQAYLTSPFDESAIMIVDGQGVPMERTFGDQLSGCIGYGNKNEVKILEELPVKYSLGSMYSSFTSKIGFKTNEEGKTMGLAPYGTSRIYNKLKQELIFNKKKYDFRNWKKLISKKFSPDYFPYVLPNYSRLLSKYPKRNKKDPIEKFHMDLAYAAQKITEDVMIYLGNRIYEKTKSKNLCIAGGVGLNCVANHVPYLELFL